MKQKILGIIPLMVVMLFVAFLAVGDNQTYANPVNQQVTVTVPQAIAISVETPISFGSVPAGTNYAVTPEYWISNNGNVKIDVYVKAGSTEFTSPTATDTIAIDTNYYIKNYNSGNFQQVTTTDQMIYNNMNKASQGSGTPTVWNGAQQRLNVPAYTEDGAYSITMIYSATKHN
ncbi:MAG: hypothetical protein QME14_09710 [Methanobacteriaceae archaeon]|nr:hypothetical protein [Methanobacteriaceae archaeon]